MKRLSIFLLLLLSACSYYGTQKRIELASAPQKQVRSNEIIITYDPTITDAWNKLEPEERIFMYYLFRASLPGNRIFSQQLHKDALPITNLFENTLNHKREIYSYKSALAPLNLDIFFEQVTTYLTHLWTHHCQYFIREHANEKRTPQKLGLSLLTYETLNKIFTLLDLKSDKKELDLLQKSIFDDAYQPTLTVPDSIEKSATNIYSSNFIDKDFQTLSPEQQSKINNYFFIEASTGKRIARTAPYALHYHFSEELTVIIFWLEKALSHAKKYPKRFDAHLCQSLNFLIKFFVTGDESLFKQHSIEWLQSSSRIDYVLGFIETYRDPKSYRGSFQADATITQYNLEQLTNRITYFEQKLPTPAAYKASPQKTTTSNQPRMRASVRAKLFGTGDLGPLAITSAYCLPNYGEIRSQIGSKQIMYPSRKSIPALINPTLYKKLFYTKKQADWLSKNDPNNTFLQDLWLTQCILHETIGHGSGKSAQHTFVNGDQLIIEGKKYTIGDTIPVTSANISQFLKGYTNTLEELRAEIIALYASVIFFDDIVTLNLLQQWASKIDKKELQTWLILNMCYGGLKRVLQQSRSTKVMAGAHAQADWTIMNYLITHGGVTPTKESVTHNNKTHTVLGLTVTNFEKTIQAIKELLILVQTCKSTGDGQKTTLLIKTYGTKLDPTQIRILFDNEQAIVGNAKVIAYLHPLFTPLRDHKTKAIIDVNAVWPSDIFAWKKATRRYEMSTNE